MQRKIATISVPAMRLLREQNGVSLRVLAERTGCSPSSLSRIENGDSVPRLSTAEKIAGALKCKMTDIWELRF